MGHFYGEPWAVTPLLGDLTLVIPTLLPHLVERKVTSTHHLVVLPGFHSLCEPLELTYELPSPPPLMLRDKPFYAAECPLQPLLETRAPQVGRAFRDNPVNCLLSWTSACFHGQMLGFLDSACFSGRHGGRLAFSERCLPLGTDSARLSGWPVYLFASVAKCLHFGTVLAIQDGPVTAIVNECSPLETSYASISYPSTDILLGDAALCYASMGRTSIDCTSKGCVLLGCASSRFASMDFHEKGNANEPGSHYANFSGLCLSELGTGEVGFKEPRFKELCFEGLWVKTGEQYLNGLCLKELGLTELCQGSLRVSGLYLIRFPSLFVWSPPLNDAACSSDNPNLSSVSFLGLWCPLLNDAAWFSNNQTVRTNPDEPGLISLNDRLLVELCFQVRAAQDCQVTAIVNECSPFGTIYASMSYPSTNYMLLGDAALGYAPMGCTSIDCASKDWNTPTANLVGQCRGRPCLNPGGLDHMRWLPSLVIGNQPLNEAACVFNGLTNTRDVSSIICFEGVCLWVLGLNGLCLQELYSTGMNLDEKNVNALCLDEICLDRLSLKELGLTELCCLNWLCSTLNSACLSRQSGDSLGLADKFLLHGTVLTRARLSGQVRAFQERIRLSRQLGIGSTQLELCLRRSYSSSVMWSPPLNDAAWPDIWSPPLNDAAHSSTGLPFIKNPLHYLISKKRTPRIKGFGFTPNALPHIRDNLQHLDLLDEHCVRLLIGETEDDSQAVVELDVEVNVNVPDRISQNVGAAGVQTACNHYTH